MVAACADYQHELTVVATPAELGGAIRSGLKPELLVCDTRVFEGTGELRGVASAASALRAGLLVFVPQAYPETAVLQCWAMGCDDVLPNIVDTARIGARVCVALRHRRQASTRATPSGRLTVVTPDDTELYLDVASISYIEAARNNCYVMECCRRHLCRQSMSEVEQGLPNQFMRVHRSFIVNLDHVAGSSWINRWTWTLVMDNPIDSVVPVSRDLVEQVRARLAVMGLARNDSGSTRADS